MKTRNLNKELHSYMMIAIMVVITGTLSSCIWTRKYEYVDIASIENRLSRPIDPNKWDYLLTGDSAPEPICGTLIVDSSPQGAKIILDGERTGLKTPAIIDKVKEGKHVVTIRYKGVLVKCRWIQCDTETHHYLIMIDSDGKPVVRSL